MMVTLFKRCFSFYIKITTCTNFNASIILKHYMKSFFFNCSGTVSKTVQSQISHIVSLLCMLCVENIFHFTVPPEITVYAISHGFYEVFCVIISRKLSRSNLRCYSLREQKNAKSVQRKMFVNLF